MVKFSELVTVDEAEEKIKEAWSFGQKMMAKYCLSDLGGVMGMEPDTFKDVKNMYELAQTLKDQAIQAIKQQNQQSQMLYELCTTISDLREEIGYLREEIDSLKSSETKKKLDNFKKGLNDLGIEVEED